MKILLLKAWQKEILPKKTVPENQYNYQRLGSNQTTQSRTKDAQRLF